MSSIQTEKQWYLAYLVIRYNKLYQCLNKGFLGELRSGRVRGTFQLARIGGIKAIVSSIVSNGSLDVGAASNLQTLPVALFNPLFKMVVCQMVANNSC